MKVTPTTGRVRQLFQYATAWDMTDDVDIYIKNMRKNLGEEFDRWLNTVRAEVWEEAMEADYDNPYRKEEE